MLFVVLDDKAHVLTEDGTHTVCYLTVPYGSDYSSTQPDDLCAECAQKAGIEKPAKAAPEPEPEKAKAKGGAKA